MASLAGGVRLWDAATGELLDTCMEGEVSEPSNSGGGGGSGGEGGGAGTGAAGTAGPRRRR